MVKSKKIVILFAIFCSFFTIGTSSVFADELIRQADGTVVVASEPMNVEQILSQYMDDFGVDKAQAIKELGINPYERAANTYRTLSQRYQVTPAYQPTITFYCETSESGGFRGIHRILNVGLNRYYGGTSKAFGGTVYTNLENANVIYYDINGDYYNTGTTSTNIGISIPVGGKGTVNFGVSHASNHYAYKRNTGRIRF
ncbi:TPA: hypothetical protein ACGO7R_000148 [Streptococcus suis]